MKALIAALALVSTGAFAEGKVKEAFTGMELAEFDAAYDSLKEYYGDALPSPVYLAYTQGSISRFSSPNVVVLSFTDLMNDEQRVPTVTHEASHLGNFGLTKGQSKENAFRFIDEGFASIWQFKSNVDGYKGYTMGVAKEYLGRGKIAFTQIQDWRTYFGSRPEEFDYKAYNVGSSFVFYVTDTYGEDGFQRLLREIGNTKDLAEALQAALGISLNDAEQAWKAYIAG